MTHTFTWRCHACPRPRTTVETTEDTPPVCRTCGKVMETHDCCGVSGATEVKYYLPPQARKVGIPFEQTLDAAFGRSGVYPAEHTPNYSNPFETPEPRPVGDYEAEHFTTIGGRRVPLGVTAHSAVLPDVVPGGIYKLPHGVEAADVVFTTFNTTNLERRLDVTERLVRELTERLYPVTAGDVETEVASDCSPLGERVERLNNSLGRLLGGLDLP